MRIPIIALRVLDQDRALKFYTETLGFTVTEDMDFGGHMRWITVSPPGAPEQEVLLERVGPPIVDQATFDELVAKGVEVIEEPMERFYGIDAAFRDDSGNHIRMTQRVETGIPAPESAVNG
jgi:catechol 2,3-dioxygenase-like lactoylglutathione lyase family enzyme